METIPIYSQRMAHSVATEMVMATVTIRVDRMGTGSLTTPHNGGTQTEMDLVITR